VTRVNAAGGQGTLTLDDSVTTTIEPGRDVYDLVATDSGGVSPRVVEGQAIVTPGVTR
jgi:hypothetical protein